MDAPARKQKRAEPQPSTADEVAAAALRELPEALDIIFDEDLCLVLAAGSTLERAGEDSGFRPGSPVVPAFPSELRGSIEPLLRSALEGETRSREIWTADYRHCLMLEVGPVRLGAEPSGPEGAPAGGVAVLLDATARRQADIIAGRGTGDGFEAVFEQAPVGTGLLDTDGRWLLVNRALCDITGYTSEELIGKRFEGIVHPDDAHNDLEQRQALIDGRIRAFRVEKRYFDASGETVTGIMSMSLVRAGDGSPLHYVAQLHDISERRRMDEQVRHLADHDPLTGLRNSRLFDHDLRIQIARSQRYGELAGLILITLDGLQTVGDTYGARTCDAILRAVARALGRRLRQTDLVAYRGGGQFAVLLPHIDVEGILVVADGLSRVLLACAVDAGDAVVHPSASIAFALIDACTESPEQVLSEAEGAVRDAARSRGARGD